MTTTHQTSTNPTTGKVTDIAPDLAAQWIAGGDTVLVDVREDFEHAEERIDGALLAPLSKFDPDALRTRCSGSRIVFHCRSGKRAQEAANRYAREGDRVFNLDGGIEAWKAAGQPVVRPAKSSRIPVMRQVQIVAGSLTAIGTALGVAVSPWFLIIPAFVGCGLTMAGITGWCGMAMVLGRMPWNRASSPVCSVS